MRRHLMLGLLACVLCSPQAIAQESSTDMQYAQNGKRQKRGKKKQTFSGKEIVERETVDADSSEANRENKEWDLVAELAGFSVAPLPSAGITAGYYLRPDMVVELNYARGSINIIFFEVFSDVVSLRLKKYWGNSFYTNTGLASRTIGAGFTLEPLTGSSELEAESSATSLVFDFSIGNKWQFENFTIGCDWIGSMVPLAVISTKDDLPNGVDEADQEEKEKEFEDLALRGSAQFLRFYLGASF